MRYILLLVTTLLSPLTMQGAPNESGRGEFGVETGQVRWLRDHDQALDLAKKTGKPVFALFQEVPGCAGCQHFGKSVLSDPILVTLIEEEFIPLLIFNNQGSDEALLQKYGERAWNYQVVRFLNGKGEDIIPRKERVWKKPALVKRMHQSLLKLDRKVPPSLERLVRGEKEPALKEAAFAMHCFWTGEMHLGQIDGVIFTEAGWVGGNEVTYVKYDENKIKTEALVKRAKKIRCAHHIYLPEKELSSFHKNQKVSLLSSEYRRAKKSDQKKQIQGTRFEKLDLTPQQATKVNAWSRVNQKKALSFLSPEQRAILQLR